VTGDWHTILVRGMSLVFVGLNTYRAALLVYWVFLWVGTSFGICCQMYRIVSTRKPYYLYWELQFMSDLIVCRHHYAATAPLFFVRGAVLWSCLPTSVRGESSEGKFRSRCRAFVEETSILPKSRNLAHISKRILF
jgi:hypothetical protein